MCCNRGAIETKFTAVGDGDHPAPAGIADWRHTVGRSLDAGAQVAEYDAKRTLNTTQTGQQYDEAGQLVMTAS